LQFRQINGVTPIAACGPPGGGRNKITERLTSLFTQLRIPQPDEKSLFNIFSSIIVGHITSSPTSNKPFSLGLRELCPSIIRASIDLYKRALKELRPTPSKCHYLFNLRDLSKVFQGMLNSQPQYVPDEDCFILPTFFIIIINFQHLHDYGVMNV
jgi:dynein heavy chain